MNIVVLDGYTLNPGDISWDPLRRLGHLTVYDRTPADEVAERAREADIVLVNKQLLAEDVIAKLPRLRMIGVTATGYNNVDTEAAGKRGIVVSNVRGYSTLSVAQHTFALLLALVNRVEMHSGLVAEGEWTRSPDWSFRRSPLVELSGKTLGLIGYGDIGKQVARIGTAFGMDVIVHRRNRGEGDGEARRTLDELFRGSDVVSLHCPLTNETKEIVNAASLSLMKSSAFLVNTGRGALIDEAALAGALNREEIAGAGLDVLSEEPPRADHQLLHARNCVITPHIAWASLEARKRLLDLVALNISAFMSGKPVNLVG